MMKEPSFTIGMEEEYMVVDRETRDLIREAPAGLMDDCQAAMADQESFPHRRCSTCLSSQ